MQDLNRLQVINVCSPSSSGKHSFESTDLGSCGVDQVAEHRNSRAC